MKISMLLFPLLAVAAVAGANFSDLKLARDHQDLGALDRVISSLESADQSKPDTLYELATAYSYAAEVAMEQHKKPQAQEYAERGFPIAERLVDSNPHSAEDHRLLGQICGQVIPASPLMGTMKYGPCAKSEIDKAIALNPNLGLAYVSRAVGLFYLPPSFGGGIDPALKELDKALSLDPKLSEAYLWKGVMLAKSKRDDEARNAFETALKLDPERVWAKQELAKLPAPAH